MAPLALLLATAALASPPAADPACRLAPPAPRTAEDLEIDGDFADVPKLTGGASPTSCTGRHIQAWFSTLEAAVRGRHALGESPPQLSPLMTNQGDYQNPITHQPLVLDTSAGGGYACCEQATFYVYVDPVENVFWINDFQAALHKQGRSGWYGPFAASSPRTRSDALAAGADALAAGPKAYVERFASTALTTGEIPADLGCEDSDLSRLLVRTRVRQLGALRGHGPLQVEILRTQQPGQPERMRALVATQAQFASASAAMRFSLELHDGRWILLHLAFDLSPEDSRRLLSDRPAHLAPVSPSRAIAVQATVRSGTLDAASIERVVGGSVAKLALCRLAPYDHDPDRPGRLTLAMTLDGSGKVAAISLKATTFDDPEVGRCAVEVVGKMRFAASQPGPTQVTLGIGMP